MYDSNNETNVANFKQTGYFDLLVQCTMHTFCKQILEQKRWACVVRNQRTTDIFAINSVEQFIFGIGFISCISRLQQSDGFLCSAFTDGIGENKRIKININHIIIRTQCTSLLHAIYHHK